MFSNDQSPNDFFNLNFGLGDSTNYGNIQASLKKLSNKKNKGGDNKDSK